MKKIVSLILALNLFSNILNADIFSDGDLLTIFKTGKEYNVTITFVQERTGNNEILKIYNVIFVDYIGDSIVFKTKDKKIYQITAMYIKYIKAQEL